MFRTTALCGSSSVAQGAMKNQISLVRTMNVRTTHLIALALTFAVIGCNSQQETCSDAAEKPTPKHDYHLKYKSWTGISPGAGFTFTSLQYVELDLAKSRIRRFWKSASHPNPMLPRDDSEIEQLIAEVPWTDLTPEQADSYRNLIGDWLKTEPPPIYHSVMALGREDGHVTRVTVRWGPNAVTTALIPSRGYRKGDPLLPPKEWEDMLNLLLGTPEVPAETLQPFRR